MMRRRGILLLGVAAAALTAAVVALTPEAPPPAPASSGLVFPGLAARLGDVREIVFRRGTETLVLERQGERFVIPARAGYPARQERVREALVGLTELRLIEPRTADPAQHERLGVDDPAREGTNAVLVTLRDAAGGTVASLVVGRRRLRTQGGLPESVYIRRPDDAQSWLAEGRVIVDTTADLWLDRDIANLPFGQLLRATMKRLDGPELVAAVTEERDFHLIAPADAPPTDDSKVEEVGRAFEFLTFQEVLPESQAPGEPLGEARFEYRDGTIVTAWPQRDRQMLWLRLRADGGPAAERLDARWRGWAYQVGPWKERQLLPRLEELLATAPEAPPAAR